MTPRIHTCAHCGKTGTWTKDWRYRTVQEPEPYYNPAILDVFCSDACERAAEGRGAA